MPATPDITESQPPDVQTPDPPPVAPVKSLQIAIWRVEPAFVTPERRGGLGPIGGGFWKPVERRVCVAFRPKHACEQRPPTRSLL